MRSRAGLDLVELRIVVVIIVVLALIALPLYWKFTKDVREKRTPIDCLRALAAAVEKNDAAATCPVSGKPYAPAFACPDPGGHLGPPIRARRAAGAIVLEQTLPPGPVPEELPGDGVTLRTDSRGDALQLRILNGAWYRRLWGPLLAALLLLLAGVTVYEARSTARRERRGLRLFDWAPTILLVGGAVAAIGYFHRTTLLEVDGPRGRVARSVRGLGFPCGSAVHEGVAGVVAVKRGGIFDVVALKKGEKGFEAVVLVSVPEASLGVARLCQERFQR